jgi:hypothetical protein
VSSALRHASTCFRIGSKLRCIGSIPTEIESSRENDFESAHRVFSGPVVFGERLVDDCHGRIFQRAVALVKDPARKERHPDGLNVSGRCHDLQDDRVRFVRPSLPAIFRFEKITRVPTERRIAFVWNTLMKNTEARRGFERAGFTTS